MSLNRTDVVKVPLPIGVKAGVIVGRGGHNCRWLHYNSGGAHISVNDTAISIRAKDNLVRARATQLVRRQLEAMIKLATHECTASARFEFVLLESAFGPDPRVRFSPRNDEIAAATCLKDKLYELVSTHKNTGGVQAEGAARTPSSSRDSSLRDLTASTNLKSESSANSFQMQRDEDVERDQDKGPSYDLQHGAGEDTDGATRFHAASSTLAAALAEAGVGVKRCGSPPLLASAGRALASAAQKAMYREPAFDVLKIRFKLGKSLFRNLGPKMSRSELSVADLENAGCGRGTFKPAFSNYVPASTVPRVTSWLTDTLGFTLTDTKTTATFHIINQELNVHYSVALHMERGDDSTTSLRKLKVGNSNSYSVTLMAAPEQMDLRLKLISQFREHPVLQYDADAYLTARRVAAAVRTEGFDGFTRSKRGLPRNRHLEYARRKTKFVYEGCLPASSERGCGQRLRVSVTQVQDDKGTHYEVSGCLPEVDAKLRQLLSQQQGQQQRPASAASDDSEELIPEWRRRGRSSGGTIGCRGDRGVHDSVSSTPTRTRAPTPDPDTKWAVKALVSLSNFITELNSRVESVFAGRPSARDNALQESY